MRWHSASISGLGATFWSSPSTTSPWARPAASAAGSATAARVPCVTWSAGGISALASAAAPACSCTPSMRARVSGETSDGGSGISRGTGGASAAPPPAAAAGAGPAVAPPAAAAPGAAPAGAWPGAAFFSLPFLGLGGAGAAPAAGARRSRGSPCSTCTTSWASRRRSFSLSPGPSQMSLPTVNARACTARADSRSAGSLCTRMADRSALSSHSSTPRTLSASISPGLAGCATDAGISGGAPASPPPSTSAAGSTSTTTASSVPGT